MSKRYRFWMLIALVGAIVIVICVSTSTLVRVYQEYWLRVKTLDEFGVLCGEVDRYLTLYPNAEASDIECNLKARYFRRTGKATPVDAWGHPISIEVAVVDDLCILTLHSNGLDGLPGTQDDVVQRSKFRWGVLAEDSACDEKPEKPDDEEMKSSGETGMPPVDRLKK